MNPSEDAAREVRRQWQTLLFGLLVLTALLSGLRLLWRADLAIYDAGLPGAEAPGDIVIVAIDDRSLAAIGRWPWSRAVHASLLDRLRAAGAIGVAFDLIFNEPDRAHPDNDAILADAMRQGPPTVLPFIVEMPAGPSGRIREEPPVPVLAAAAAGLGHIHLELDRDGIARSVFLREGIGAPNHSQLMLELLQATGKAPALIPGVRRPRETGDATSWMRDDQLMIPFLGPPGHFVHYSYSDVISGVVDPASLRGRWVLIGVTAQGLADGYPTPRSGESTAMSGVEINANILQALRSGTSIRPLGIAASALLCCIPVLLAIVGFRRLTPRHSLIWVMLLWAGTLALCVGVLRTAHWWWSCSPSLVSLTLAYPLWSWRRLENTQRYLEAQLAQFHAEHPPLLSLLQERPAPSPFGDAIQHRIELFLRATDRLRELGQLLALAIDVTPDATLVIDNDGKVALANAAACLLLHEARQGIQGRPIDSLSRLTSSLQPLDFRRLAAEAPRTVELRLTGDPKDLLLRAVPFVIDSDSRLGTLLTMVDISDMRRNQREREDVLRFLSHDLKSPATSLLGLAQLQRDPSRRLPDDDLAARLDRLARRLLDLLDGFIALAHAESVDPVEFTDCDLLDILQDAQDEVWAAAESRHVEIVSSVPEVSVRVHGDRQLLARAITNLLSNAARFSPPQASIRVCCTCTASAANIVVEDDGPGVAPEDRQHLFRRFARIGSRERRAMTGAGLGLAFVSVVAQKHGGSTRYEDAANGGARFVLEVPLGSVESGIA